MYYSPQHRKRPRFLSEINVVPYIDVMLVLLVIFMITAPMLTQGVKVDLPQVGAEPVDTQEREPLLVNVDAEGRYYVNVGAAPEQPITIDELLAKVAAVLRRKPNTPVLMGGDRSVPYGAVVRAIVLLQEAGAPSVGLITETPLPPQPR
jgi:biopolymer transport protein TolR